MSTRPVDSAEQEAMTLALAEAQQAVAAGEIPVGAIVLGPDGDVIAKARNDREHSLDPSAHAEVLAIRRAAIELGDRMLNGCTLVVTLEPCAMCAGTILAARIPRVIFGAWDDKAGAAGSVYDLLRDGRLPHASPEVIGGVLAESSTRLLEEFFAKRREV